VKLASRVPGSFTTQTSSVHTVDSIQSFPMHDAGNNAIIIDPHQQHQPAITAASKDST